METMEARLLPWGNSFGLRIRKQDVERLGLQPGQSLQVVLPDFRHGIDLSHWPTFDLGGDAVTGHDEGFDEL